MTKSVFEYVYSAAVFFGVGMQVGGCSSNPGVRAEIDSADEIQVIDAAPGFVPGQVVTLKSDSYGFMTIDHFKGGQAVCVWLDKEDRPRSALYSLEALED